MPRPTPLQDRQARGQPAPPRQPTHRAFGNPLASSAGPSAAKAGPGRSAGSANSATQPPRPLTYAEEQRIDNAAWVLSSWEELAMHATANAESIPQTRLRFEKKMLGIEDEGSGEWEDEVDEPWVSDEEVVQAGKAETKAEKKSEKGKGTPKKGGTPKKAGREERRESGGRRDEGTFDRLRREREERRRER
ncbi:hypothetical protein MMC11_006631 [Xylographa trunciseda]|nr:hypothetical protein [Xylographa trunciseda]